MTAVSLVDLRETIRVKTEAAVMARPKSKQGKPAAPLRTLGIKASAEWADWLERFAKHQRTTVASLIDRSLAKQADVEGFDEPPPERVP
jgi:hypothetical protein